MSSLNFEGLDDYDDSAIPNSQRDQWEVEDSQAEEGTLSLPPALRDFRDFYREKGSMTPSFCLPDWPHGPQAKRERTPPSTQASPSSKRAKTEPASIASLPTTPQSNQPTAPVQPSTPQRKHRKILMTPSRSPLTSGSETESDMEGVEDIGPRLVESVQQAADNLAKYHAFTAERLERTKRNLLRFRYRHRTLKKEAGELEAKLAEDKAKLQKIIETASS